MRKVLQVRVYIAALMIVAAVAASLSISALTSPTDDNPTKNSARGGIALAAPPFQTGGDGFPADLAAMSGYARLATSVDIAQIRDAFYSIDEETTDHIIGAYLLSGLAEAEFPRVYVDTDGWIVAFVPRGGPYNDAVIAPWSLTWPLATATTSLEMAITQFATDVGALIQPEGVSYYHFEKPTATNMLLVGESGNSVESFSITFPDTITVVSSEWRTWIFGTNGWVTLNGQQFASGDGFGEFIPSTFVQNETYDFSFRAFGANPASKFAIVILYQ